jgi:predicted Zn-dependent protease
MKALKTSFTVCLVVVLVVACATSPTGRRQLLLFSESELAALGATAFDQMKEQTKVSRDETVNRYVNCVGDAIIAVLPERQRDDWEIVVFQEDSANAFALPGRKIGVHTGLLQVATNQDQLAAVVGHEIGHVLSRHSAERMSVQFATATGHQLLGSVVGGTAQGNAVMAALGLGAQVGVILPYSRLQESEADQIGVELMAKAGFDPRASVELWHNMAAGRDGPPEFLSTHPAPQTRIRDLEKLVPKVMPDYERARAQGRKPNCKAP